MQVNYCTWCDWGLGSWTNTLGQDITNKIVCPVFVALKRWFPRQDELDVSPKKLLVIQNYEF